MKYLDILTLIVVLVITSFVAYDSQELLLSYKPWLQFIKFLDCLLLSSSWWIKVVLIVSTTWLMVRYILPHICSKEVK